VKVSWTQEATAVGDRPAELRALLEGLGVQVVSVESVGQSTVRATLPDEASAGKVLAADEASFGNCTSQFQCRTKTATPTLDFNFAAKPRLSAAEISSALGGEVVKSYKDHAVLKVDQSRADQLLEQRTAQIGGTEVKLMKDFDRKALHRVQVDWSADVTVTEEDLLVAIHLTVDKFAVRPVQGGGKALLKFRSPGAASHVLRPGNAVMLNGNEVKLSGTGDTLEATWGHKVSHADSLPRHIRAYVWALMHQRLPKAQDPVSAAEKDGGGQQQAAS